MISARPLDHRLSFDFAIAPGSYSLASRVRFPAWAGRLGEDHVGFGSDFDGAQVPDGIVDVAGLPRLIEAMLARKQVIESLQGTRAETVHLFNELAQRLPDHRIRDVRFKADSQRRGS